MHNSTIYVFVYHLAPTCFGIVAIRRELAPRLHQDFDVNSLRMATMPKHVGAK